jgi:hypothetical protein
MLDINLFLKSQRNQLHRAIVDCGLKPEYFKTVNAESERQSQTDEITILYQLPDYQRYWFRFDRIRENGHLTAVECCPWSATTLNKFAVSWSDWNTLFQQITGWLNFVKREAAEDDFWAEVETQTNYENEFGQDALPNAPLSSSSRQTITQLVEELKSTLKDHDEIDQKRHERILRELALINEQTKYLGIKDFKNAVLGATIQMAMAAGMDSQVTPIISQFLQKLGSVLHGMPALPWGNS